MKLAKYKEKLPNSFYPSKPICSYIPKLQYFK